MMNGRWRGSHGCAWLPGAEQVPRLPGAAQGPSNWTDGKTDITRRFRTGHYEARQMIVQQFFVCCVCRSNVKPWPYCIVICANIESSIISQYNQSSTIKHGPPGDSWPPPRATRRPAWTNRTTLTARGTSASSTRYLRAAPPQLITEWGLIRNNFTPFYTIKVYIIVVFLRVSGHTKDNLLKIEPYFTIP